jgi:hypothetical protein
MILLPQYKQGQEEPNTFNMSCKKTYDHIPSRRCLLSSPIILARTNTVLKVMELICIPYYDFSTSYLGYELGGSVAVTTYPKILDDAEHSTRRCADEPKCNS